LVKSKYRLAWQIQQPREALKIAFARSFELFTGRVTALNSQPMARLYDQPQALHPLGKYHSMEMLNRFLDL
jgi:hypothetical protein